MHKRCLLLFAVCAISLPFPVWAASPAGKVAATAGEVTAAGKDGVIRKLILDSPVFAGDIISTGPNSKVRIVFSDEGVIFIRPASRFVIDSYQHSGKPGQDESKFSLVRGGFRSVTGAIGQTSKENYKINTPVATIGIRGTDHEGRFCAGDCFDLVNIGVNAPPDGLYTGTSSGETVVGGQNFRAGEYGFTSPGMVTLRLPEPPPILVADPNLQGALTMVNSQTTGGDNPPPAGQSAPQNAQNPEDSDRDAIEIPAKPNVLRAVQCY